MLSHLDMKEAHDHCKKRLAIHQQLAKFLYSDDDESFVRLVLGISDTAGNYSASEYQAGNIIVQANGAQANIDLAKKLDNCSAPAKIPDIITNSRLSYLKISVGSEMSIMLLPSKFWTANVRTVWASLLIKYGDNYEAANEDLALYRSSSSESAMDYSVWAAMHPTLEIPLSRLYHLGVEEANRQNVKPGRQTYLWADAIADMLYYKRTEK
jgi:hypothetical protein